MRVLLASLMRRCLTTLLAAAVASVLILVVILDVVAAAAAAAALPCTDKQSNLRLHTHVLRPLCPCFGDDKREFCCHCFSTVCAAARLVSALTALLT